MFIIFQFYSRNSHDFTKDFGARPCEGKFSYYIDKALDSNNVESVILDGEICPYNRKTESLSQKSEKNDIRHIKDDNNMYQQCFVIYDIVYFNGQVLTNMPLKKRILTLREVVPHEIPGTYVYCMFYYYYFCKWFQLLLYHSITDIYIFGLWGEILIFYL